LELSIDLRQTVVWLDELENFIGPDGLTLDVLERLLAAGQGSITILGTMRSAVYDQFGIRGDVVRPERRVLERARIIRLPRRLDAMEAAQANEQFNDRRLIRALDRYGLGEYLAAGPELADRFENAATINPVGQAVVRAAADWKRVGLARPVPLDICRSLARNYVSPDQSLTTEELDGAFAWAAEQVLGTSALLTIKENHAAAFDYIIDYIEQERHDDIPHATFEDVFAAVDDQAELFAVGVSAKKRGQPDIEERAMRRIVNEHPPELTANAATNLGVLLKEQGELEEAERLWRQAWEFGDAYGAANLAELQKDRGDNEGAERLFREAAEKGYGGAAFRLAFLLEERNAIEEAEEWLRRAAATGHADSAHHLGTHHQERNELEEAERWYRRAADLGSIRALTNLGVLLAQRDELEEAEQLWRQAWNARDGRAAASLGELRQVKGDLDDAKAWYQTAADAGYAGGASALGLLLEEEGELEEAEEWYRRAAEAGDPMSAFHLGVHLAERGELEEAERLWRQAHTMDTAYAAIEIGLLAEDRGELSEAERWYRKAAEREDPRAATRLANLLHRRGQTEEAERLWRQAWNAGDREAGVRLGIADPAAHPADDDELAIRVRHGMQHPWTP
jgi:TPR repeat protein